MSDFLLSKANIPLTPFHEESIVSFSGIIFSVKEKFKELELKRKIFDKMFPLDQESGFYMNQRPGKCYLIAAMNAMRLNPYFMDELYENMEFSKEDNIYKTKVFYTFPDGEEVIVSIKDLKTQKEDPRDYNKIKITELNNLAKEVLMHIVKNGDIEKLIKEGKVKYVFDSRNKKRVFFENSFIQDIIEEIIARDGKYFDILNKTTEYKAVDAPIGYKILEALYTAKIEKNNNRKRNIKGKKYKKIKRKDMISGYPKDVLKTFLSKEKWNISSYRLYYENNKNKFIKILKNFDKKKHIITTSINLINYSMNITQYFNYKDYEMADGHAYSIIGFNEKENKIEIVNPWDNNKIMYFSMEDFLKLFTNVSVAERKEKKS